MSECSRTTSFGEGYTLSAVDRFGTWLSLRAIRRSTGPLSGLRFIDVGCGFDARLAFNLLSEAAATTVVDISLSDAVKNHPRITAVQGELPSVLDTLPENSFDVITCVSVLEHVWEDVETLRQFRRLVAPGGVVVVNVPSWWGKIALEASAFRLGLSPASEMNDHKRYYNPRDLWPSLVRAGFRPQDITCRRHKLGLNTLAVCRLSA